MRIYVASSWRNAFQPSVVDALRADGHDVYDFRHPPTDGDGADGFSWREVDPTWQDWCVYVMPCGVSASLEVGWACGAGKRTFVYVPGLRAPDLMVKMAELVTAYLSEIRAALSLRACAEAPATEKVKEDDLSRSDTREISPPLQSSAPTDGGITTPAPNHADLIHRLRSRAMIEAPPDNGPDTRAAFEDVPEITFDELSEIAALLSEAANALEAEALAPPAPKHAHHENHGGVR